MKRPAHIIRSNRLTIAEHRLWPQTHAQPRATGIALPRRGEHTPKPERVLSPRQTDAFEKALDRDFRGGGGDVYNVSVTIPVSDLGELRSAVDFADRIKRTARAGTTTLAGMRS